MAGRPCSICQHPDRAEIDAVLVAGESFESISKRFGMAPASVFRHRATHLAAAMAKASREQAAADQRAGEDLVEQVRGLRSKAVSILLAAERAGDLKTALSGIRTALACLELLLECEARIDRRPTITLVTAPEWLVVRSTLLTALGPYPEARVAVAGALMVLESA